MKTLTALGDSQTDLKGAYGVGPYDTWAPCLARFLGSDWQGRAFGVSGDTSTQALARADAVFMHETPDIFAVATGVNDNITSIPNAATTLNLQAMLMAAKHAAYGRRAGTLPGITAAAPAALPGPQTSHIGTRIVVLDDDSTTGGVAAAADGQAPRIAGSVSADANGNKVTVWECRQLLPGEYGWGRVANRTTAPTAVQRAMVIPNAYRNWTSGGDTPSTPVSTYASLRAALQAAVTVEAVDNTDGEPSVVYSDLYGFMRSRIVNGDDPDFSATTYNQARSWHCADSNQHYSAYGHTLKAVKANIDARAAWPTLFT